MKIIQLKPCKQECHFACLTRFFREALNKQNFSCPTCYHAIHLKQDHPTIFSAMKALNKNKERLAQAAESLFSFN